MPKLLKASKHSDPHFYHKLKRYSTRVSCFLVLFYMFHLPAFLWTQRLRFTHLADEQAAATKAVENPRAAPLKVFHVVFKQISVLYTKCLPMDLLEAKREICI